MLRAMDFRLTSVQAAIFLSDTGSFSQSKFLATILGRFATRYDGAVQAMPFKDDVPAEVPRVILQSHDEQWKLQAALNRIDAFWFARTLSTESIGIAAQCVEVLQHYVQAAPSVQIVRLGFVVRRIGESENPAQELIDRFCNAESKMQPFNRSESFEIHNHKKYSLKKTGFSINSWVRCRAGMATPPLSKKAILIEQDINTLEDNLQNMFSCDDISKFYMESQNEIENILQIYFP